VLPGHDWIVVKLGKAARIRRVEVDTNHFKGNFPDSALIEGVYLDPAAEEVKRMQPMDFHRPHALLDGKFVPILAQTKLNAHEQRYFEKDQLQSTDALVTHIRMKIFPDGGVSRLRMWGEIEADKQ
jgi:allantoicase